MGYIVTLKANKLLGKSDDNSDVYPVTATSAVYDSNGKSLETRLQEAYKGDDTAIPNETIDDICI